MPRELPAGGLSAGDTLQRVGEDPATQPPRGEGRQAIVAAAIRVVAERGFEGLTYREVGKRAGATHGLISYHFGTREALIREVAVETGRRAVASVSMLDAGGGVRDFACNLPESADDEIETHFFRYELALEARRRPEVADVMRDLYEEYYLRTFQVLRALDLSSLDPDLVRVVFSALDGLVIQQVIYGDPQQTREALTELHHLLGGLGARGG